MKEKVDVTGVPETMLQTLYARAKETKKSEMSWPVETVSGKMFYLDGAHCKTTDAASENQEEKGACGTGDSCGSGVLTVTIPQKDGMDEYDYDPENPAVHIVDMSQNELEIPEDYTEEEKRSDILTYGMIGAKYRNGFEHPEYLELDKIYKITIRTTKLSNTFLPGHRMRVTITSGAKNFMFPNSNTREGFNSETRQKAHITIHRGGAYASGILLPIEESAK